MLDPRPTWPENSHEKKKGIPRATFVVSSPRCSVCHESGHSAEESAACSYRVVWSINPHMRPGAVDPREAFIQHQQFEKILGESGAEVLEVPFVHAAYDSVFVKDNAILGTGPEGRVAYLARPLNMQRRCEQESRREALRELGFRIVGCARYAFEGGDIVIPSGRDWRLAFLGYGQRSSLYALPDISHFLKREVVPLQLVDPLFYHLDTAFVMLDDGTALACEDAFSPESWRILRGTVRELIPVPAEEALRFGLNLVEVGSHIVLGSEVPQIRQALQALGKQVHVTPLQQFQYGGGSAACLTARIHRIEH